MERTVSVRLSVSAEYETDLMNVQMEISGEGDSQQYCTEEYESRHLRVINALCKLGIEREAIRDIYVYVIPNEKTLYLKDDKGDYYRAKKVVEGYRFEGRLFLELPRSLNLDGAVWNALRSLDDAVTFDIDFSLANRAEAKKALVACAVEAARERAELLASSAGAKLGEVVNIEHDCARTVSRCKSVDLGLGGGIDFNPAPEEIECYVKTVWAIV